MQREASINGTLISTSYQVVCCIAKVSNAMGDFSKMRMTVLKCISYSVYSSCDLYIIVHTARNTENSALSKATLQACDTT